MTVKINQIKKLKSDEIKLVTKMVLKFAILK